MSGSGATWVKQKVGRICFRGDDRPPTEAFVSLFKDDVIFMNTKSTVPLSIYQSVLGFFSDELNHHRNGRTPPVEAGFVRSDPKAI